MRLQSGRMIWNLGLRVLQRDPNTPSFLLGACSLLEWRSRSRARRSSVGRLVFRSVSRKREIEGSRLHLWENYLLRLFISANYLGLAPGDS